MSGFFENTQAALETTRWSLPLISFLISRGRPRLYKTRITNAVCPRSQSDVVHPHAHTLTHTIQINKAVIFHCFQITFNIS